MAIKTNLGSILRPIPSSRGVNILSQTSSTIVLNTDAKSKTGSGATGANSQLNPFGVLGETSQNNANVVVVTVPQGANYLDMILEYTGTDPTTTCKVRVFGEVPPKHEYGADGLHATWPYDYDTSYYNPGNGKDQGDWKPLGDSKTGSFLIELDDSTNRVALDNGTSKRTVPKTVNIAGCTRIMVLIDTACIAPTKALVAGWFGC